MQILGTPDDLTLTFSHNPAGQIVGNTRSNDLYSVQGLAAGTVASAANGLNQLVTQGGATVVHDANGNLTSDGTNSYAYSSENLLTGAGGVTLRYDPLMRLAEVADGSTVRFAYDGVDRIADCDANGVLVRRYVHGPGMDEPLVWYVGSDVVYRRWLHADERGSIVAASVNAGTALATRAYDEYGNSTGQGDVGPFRYTGQAWVPEAGLYYYKARMYAPELGRFVQPDPIGYWGGMNLYAYVRGDPVNFTDPWGLQEAPGEDVEEDDAIIVTGSLCHGIWLGDLCVPNLGWFLSPLQELYGPVDPRTLFRESGQRTPQSEPRPCPTGSRVNLGGGASATGFLGILGLSAGLGGGVSVPTASLPLVGDGSFRGTQFFGSGSLTPSAGLGLFAGVGPSYSLGGSNGAAGNVSGSVTPVIQLGVGDGGGVEVTSDLNSPLSLSGAMGRIAAGAYGAIGARFEGKVSTDPIGCKRP